MSIDLQSRRVAEDMERLFRPIAGRNSASLPALAETASSHRRSPARWLLLGTPLAVVATGALLGMNAIGRDEPSRAANARPATAPARRAPSPDQAARVAVPASLAVEQVEPAITGEDQDVPLAAAPAITRPEPAPPVIEARAAGPVRAEAPAALAQGDPPATTRPVRDTALVASDCPQGSPEDRCIYQDMLAADRRLRLAYERARQGGVEKLVLSIVGRHWREARERAEDDPDGTIRRYDYLAGRLDDFRRDRFE